MEDALAAMQRPAAAAALQKKWDRAVVQTHKIADRLTDGRWSPNNTMYLIKT